MSTTDEAVLAAARALGDALASAKSDSSSSEFEATLRECTEEISTGTGIDYGEVCDTGSDCC